MKLIVLVSILICIQAKDCSNFPSDYIKLVGKNGETIVKDIKDFFWEDVKSQTELSLTDDQNKLTLVPPIVQISQTATPLQPNPTKVLSYSVLTNSNYEWLNIFQLFGIVNQNEYLLQWTTDYTQGMQQRVPQINAFKTIGTTDEMNCRSSIIIDTKHQLVDCESKTAEDPKNFFLLVVGDQTSEIEKISNAYPYENQERYIKGTNKYLYRISTKQNDNPSLIEMFSYNLDEKKFELKHTIDQEFVAPHMNITDYKFDLADVKIGNNDQISILDKTGNIYLFQYYDTNDTWKYDYQAILLGESISFDYNFLSNEYAVVQKNKLVSYFGYYHNVFETTDDLTSYKAHLGLTQIILASSTQLIKLNNKYFTFNINIQGNFDNILNDYTQNDFTVIGLDNLRYYQMYESYTIRYKNDAVSQGTAILKKNSCSVTIDYQNVENSSVQLIQVQKGNILLEPFYSGFQNSQNQAQHLVDGPKQRISFQPKVEETLEEGEFITLQYNGDQTVKYKAGNITLTDLTFIETHQQAQSLYQPFYVFTQNKNKLFQIYYCSTYIEMYCLIYSTLQLDIALTQQNAIISFGYYQLNLFILTNSKQIKQYTFYTINVVYDKTYDFTEDIDLMYMSNLKILTFSKNTKIINVYDGRDLSNALYSISNEEVAKLGISNWNPKKIYTNDYDDFVNILNGDNENQIIILKLNKDVFTVVEVIAAPEHTDIRIINFYQLFAILYKQTNGVYAISVYNTQIQTQIYLQKQLTLYDYTIDSLDSFFYVTYNSYLHTKAKRSSDNKYVLLSYNVQLTGHNSLRIAEEIDENNQFIRATQNLIIQFNQDDFSITEIKENPTITYQVKFNDKKFVTNLKYQIVYANEMLLLLDEEFRLANTYITVNIIKDKLNITTNVTSNKQDNFVQDMGTDWFSGEVTKFTLMLPLRNNETYVQSPIELITKNYYNDTKAVADLNTEIIFLLKNDSIILKSKSTNDQVLLKKLPEDYSCYDILANFNQELLIQCSKEGQTYIGGVKCDGQDCQIGQSWIAQDEEDDIISVNIDKDFIFLIQRQKIKVYQNQILNLATAKLYGYITFDGNSYFYGLTVQKIQDNFYHVYCTNYNGDFISQDYIFEIDKFVKKNDQQSFSLINLITKDYYTYKEVIMSQILLINIQQDNTNFKADYIMISTKGPHYAFHIEFQLTAQTSKLVSNKIVFVLQGYGNYQILGYLFPQVKILDNYILISYLDGSMTRHTLTVYKLPETQTTNEAVLFFGALNSQYYYYKNEVLEELYFYNNQLYLLANTESVSNFNQYKVNPSPKFVMDGEVSSQLGFLTVQNDFSIDSIVIQIIAPINPGPGPNPDDPSNDSSSHTGLWVVLGLIGGGIVIGGVIYLMKKKKTKVDTLM